MLRHAPTEAVQIRYPGGKDGWWRVECTAGDHAATDADPARATRRVQAHADAKNSNEKGE